MPGLKLPPRIWNKRCLGKNYLNETGHFHKYSPYYRSAYVTLQNFTPGLQKNYTDISAISVTFRNSGGMVPNSAPHGNPNFEHKNDQKNHNTKSPLCHYAGVFIFENF